MLFLRNLLRLTTHVSRIAGGEGASLTISQRIAKVRVRTMSQRAV